MLPLAHRSFPGSLSRKRCDCCRVRLPRGRRRDLRYGHFRRSSRSCLSNTWTFSCLPCAYCRSHTTPSPFTSRADGTMTAGNLLPPSRLPLTRSTPAATASSQDPYPYTVSWSGSTVGLWTPGFTTMRSRTSTAGGVAGVGVGVDSSTVAVGGGGGAAARAPVPAPARSSALPLPGPSGRLRSPP